MFRLSQFERKGVPNGWRCDTKRALRCHRLSSWYLKGHPITGSQRSTFLSLERNIGREDEFRVSGGSEFQSRGPMTEKALLPSDDLTYGMERTSESEDRVETECDGNERLL